MNVTLKKMALLEKALLEKEELLKTQGFSTVTINNDLRNKVATLMNKVRSV